MIEEETGEEGFVSLFAEDDFWALGAKGSYTRRRAFNRRFKQGKGKGHGGKQKIRPGFRPRSQKGKVISYNLLINGVYWGYNPLT